MSFHGFQSSKGHFPAGCQPAFISPSLSLEQKQKGKLLKSMINQWLPHYMTLHHELHQPLHFPHEQNQGRVRLARVGSPAQGPLDATAWCDPAGFVGDAGAQITPRNDVWCPSRELILKGASTRDKVLLKGCCTCPGAGFGMLAPSFHITGNKSRQ